MDYLFPENSGCLRPKFAYTSRFLLNSWYFLCCGLEKKEIKIGFEKKYENCSMPIVTDLSLKGRLQACV